VVKKPASSTTRGQQDRQPSRAREAGTKITTSTPEIVQTVINCTRRWKFAEIHQPGA